MLVVEDKDRALSKVRILKIMEDNVSRYERPKEIYLTEEFSYTDTMKTDRKKTMEKIKYRK